MIYRLRGLWHVRHLWTAPLVTLSMAAAAWVYYDDINVRVQPVIHELARNVGAPEFFAAVAAALLPPLCVPTYNGRERLAGPRSRRTHTLVSALLLIAPSVVFYAWYQSVRWHVPTYALPAAYWFTGNLLLMASLGLLSTLLAGQRLGPVLSLSLYAGFVVGQQAWPGSVLATQFSTAVRWTTNWWLTAAVCLVALAVDQRLRSVPRRATRFD